jgi:hypothetical protein
MALAGVGGCAFSAPPEKIVLREFAEEMIPGIPSVLCTAYAMNGHALGVSGRSHMGRPDPKSRAIPIIRPVLVAPTSGAGFGSRFV